MSKQHEVTVAFYEGESPKNGKRYYMGQVFCNGLPVTISDRKRGTITLLASRFDTPENRDWVHARIEQYRQYLMKEILNNE